jgi:hypothetical protein
LDTLPFKWLYQAPNNGYEAKAFFSQQREPKQPLRNIGIEHSYALRINTEIDKNGKIISANYVRLMNNVNLFGVLAPTQGAVFTYYFNPTPNDRNLEFDPSRNLFTNLEPTEQVREP